MRALLIALCLTFGASVFCTASETKLGTENGSTTVQSGTSLSKAEKKAQKEKEKQEQKLKKEKEKKDTKKESKSSKNQESK